MSLYSSNPSGTKFFRSRFNLSYRNTFDCDFGAIIPFMRKFVIPGDVWKPGISALIRYQPSLAPILNRSRAKFRYFFVPLRLVEPNTEKIITGSNNGTLIGGDLPVFSKFLDKSNSKVTSKFGFWDYLGVKPDDFSNCYQDKCMPAEYWFRAYNQICFDYYLDENLVARNSPMIDILDYLSTNANDVIQYASLKKDYFTSALPWQLKGVAPAFDVAVSNPFTDDVLIRYGHRDPEETVKMSDNLVWVKNYGEDIPDGSPDTNISYGRFQALNENNQVVTDQFPYTLQAKESDLNDAVTSLPFGSINASDWRTLMAQTRIFERLARCGSRFTEYLRANFGTSPADGTLQRAQYLGGFELPIVTTEIPQTAEDSTSPVGTLRGKGISSGSNSVKPFVAKEFGVIMGLLTVMPETIYSQGIDKELSYNERFDFFNPSFQSLSEQEVRNGEIFISNSDGENDDTFGYQPIYNELRKSTSKIAGDIRGSLNYWTQAISFNDRPSLNADFINSKTHLNSFNRPFAVISGSKPIICDIYNNLDVYRPMIRESVPGLIDHN